MNRKNSPPIRLVDIHQRSPKRPDYRLAVVRERSFEKRLEQDDERQVGDGYMKSTKRIIRLSSRPP